MVRRDGRPTIRENAKKVAPAVLNAILGIAEEQGYHGEAALKYTVEVITGSMSELSKPHVLARLYGGK